MFLEFKTELNSYQIEDRYYNGRPARVLYSGDGTAALSGMAKDSNPELIFDYNQRFRELIQGTKPKQVLILGGGAFTLPTALIREFPKLKLDVVELDGGLLNIAQKYFDFKPNRRTGVHIGDGRQFLEETTHMYDVIIVDVFENAALPEAFQTLRFIQGLHNHLNQHGVVAINVIASLKGRRSQGIKRLHKLLQAVFPAVQIFAATTGLSSWTSQNFVVVAQDGSWDTESYLLRPESRLL